MRTTAPALVVMCIGLAGMMLGASGFEDAWGAPAPKTDAAQEEIQKANNSSGVKGSDGPISGPVSSSDSSIVGLISDGLSGLTNIAGAVIVLPQTLINIGFPGWFAWPIGTFASALAGIGIIQFATNRVWQ